MYARIGAALSIRAPRVAAQLAAGAGADLVSSSPAEASMTQRATQLATTPRPDEHIYPTPTQPQAPRTPAPFTAQVARTAPPPSPLRPRRHAPGPATARRTLA